MDAGSQIPNLPRKNPLRFAWWAITLDAFFFTWLFLGIIVMVFLEIMRVPYPENILLYMVLFFPVIPTALFIIAIIKLLAYRMGLSKYLAIGIILHLFGTILICTAICVDLFSTLDNPIQLHINPITFFLLVFMCGLGEYYVRNNLFRE